MKKTRHPTPLCNILLIILISFVAISRWPSTPDSPPTQPEPPLRQNYSRNLSYQYPSPDPRPPALVASTLVMDMTNVTKTVAPVSLLAYTDIKEITVSKAPAYVTSTIDIPEVAPLAPLLPSVPFDAETQWRVFARACNGDKVRFCLVMAIGKYESGFDASAIGDDGQSYGYVQVKFGCHQDRLAKYSLTKDDLFDPTNCSIISIDYLNDFAGYPKELEVTHQLLMRYNMGRSGAAKAMANGHSSSEYSRKVMPTFYEYLEEFNLPV